MSRIKIVDEKKATGLQKLVLKMVKKQYGGFIPSIIKLLLADFKVGKPAGSLYRYLNLNKKSKLTRVQKEMLATVVNGAIGGAP